MRVTPDVESDVLAKLVERLPADIIVTPEGSRTARAGPMRPTTNRHAHEVFVEEFGVRADLDNDGRTSIIGVQLTVRSKANDYTGGRALSKRIQAALDLLGPWTGASGAAYMDCRAQISLANYLGPDEQGRELFAQPFEVWLDETLLPNT